MLRKLSSPPKPSAHLEKDADVKNITGSLEKNASEKDATPPEPRAPKEDINVSPAKQFVPSPPRNATDISSKSHTEEGEIHQGEPSVQ